MKKGKVSNSGSTAKTIGTRIIEKYRPRMNQLSEAERKQLLEEGLATIYRAPADSGHAHRR